MLRQPHYCPILNEVKMKKIHIILFMVFLNASFFSCTPPEISDNSSGIQACCGEGEDLPPPPPPPPGGN
jgi:hypothetical protein